MQGSNGQENDPLQNPTGRYRAVLNGTGKHSIPTRPPGLPRIEQPPARPRVGRPRRREPSPRQRRRNYLLLVGAFVVCAILAFVVSYTIYNLAQAFTQTAGASATSNSFLAALSGPHPDYAQAYSYLGPNITIYPDARANFERQAQQADSCFGTITSYSEVANSAVMQNNSLSYTYTITRSKAPSKPYQLRLTLQQDPTDSNTWKIIDYGGNLGPPDQPCQSPFVGA